MKPAYNPLARIADRIADRISGRMIRGTNDGLTSSEGVWLGMAEPPLPKGHQGHQGHLRASRRLPSLDGLRAVSILMVLAAHSVRTAGFPDWLKPYSGYLWSGGLGVRTFFVISGFLITWLLLREQAQTGRIDLVAFYKRRMLTIFPVFYAFLGTVLLLSLWVYRDFSLSEWLSAATFTLNYYPGHWTLGHLWSISVEEQFYLLWPFTLTLLETPRRLLIAAAVVILAAPVLRVLFYLSPWRWLGDYAFFTHADSLMFGCLLAILGSTDLGARLRQPLLLYRRWVQLVVVAAIYGIWMLSLHGRWGLFTVPFGATVQGMAIAALIASVVWCQAGTLYRWLNLRPMAAIGVISYGLYLWQQLILYPAAYPDGDLWWRAFPQNLVIVFMVAWLSYRWIERPFLRLKRKFAVAQ